MKKTPFLLVVLFVLFTVGCQGPQFSSEPLGEVDYAEAFRAGKRVMAQYFSIASADAESGKIISRPKAVDAARDRLLGTTPARKRAQMQIRQKGDMVFADVQVYIQRQDVAAIRQMQPVTVDNDVPNRTPADEAAAVTTEQNQAWETTGRDHQLEQKILADLFRALKKNK
ncbi:MAG: hypothetical protein KAV00_17100 [Phycisphaerae bacterium]|nr:hypothetical protein [Phycisphaerae bacterium]